MNDGGVLALPPPDEATSKLAELLKHPDDLDKISSLKTELARKKATIDSHLRVGLAAQLATTQHGMSAISDGQKTVQAIKEEMLKIDRLCAEAQGMIRDFPDINRMSVMQRNFTAVEEMKGAVDGFAMRLAEMEDLLREDDADMENQPNLLAIHLGLTGLRDVRDQAMDQVKSSEEGESGLELIDNLPLDSGATLRDMFARLDEVVEWFDDHVGRACMNIIPLVMGENHSLVVRLGLVIEEEEKKDRQVAALQDAQREFQDVASRFKSINVGHRELRGYKEKFLQAISATAESQFQGLQQAFLDDPQHLDKACRWYFNDINVVKIGMPNLLPKKWKILRTYASIYHRLMRTFLVARLDDPTISPVHMLAILHWVPVYYNKMSRLGLSESSLRPHVIDGREADLVREYRSIITRAVEQWMARITTADQRTFAARDENSLDQDADGRLHTRSLGDMWTMLREQVQVAAASKRTDVVEGVVDAMMRALAARQQMWERLVDAEFAKLTQAAESAASPGEVEGLSSFQDWLLAIANDQMAAVDDVHPSSPAFLPRFKADFTSLVTPAYAASPSTVENIASLTDAYIDLSTHCLRLFAAQLFATDFRLVSRTFFVPGEWYRAQAMAQITSTFADYLQGEDNVSQVLHVELRDVLVDELATALLVRYLESVRNRGAKFRRADPFTEKIREDILTVFNFFNAHAEAPTVEGIKHRWRAVTALEALLSAEKGAGVVEAFKTMKETYWDVQIGWVEAVLRCREDFDRGMLSAVKTCAAGIRVERGPETVLGKVK